MYTNKHLELNKTNFRENSEELRNLINSAEKRSLAEEYKEHIHQKRAMENLKMEEEKIFLEFWQKDFEERSKREDEDLMKKRELNMAAFEEVKQQILELENQKECERLEKEEDLRLMVCGLIRIILFHLSSFILQSKQYPGRREVSAPARRGTTTRCQKEEAQGFAGRIREVYGGQEDSKAEGT